MQNRIATLILFISSITWINTQAAPAPVIDLNDLPPENTQNTTFATADTDAFSPPSSTSNSTSSRQTLPTDQRVRLLEQQINNLTQMNLPAKVDNLEQQIQQLNGQLEEQTHTIQQLQNQLQQANTPATNIETPAPTPTSTTAKKTKETASSKSSTKSSNPVSSIQEEVAAETPEVQETSENPILTAENAVVQNKSKPTTSSASARTDKPKITAEKAYQAAFDLMVKKQNTQAITALNAMIKNYPDDTLYTPSAHYWLGELYSASSKNTLASKEFTTLIKQYPTHTKVPDAMLKLAIIQDEAGQRTQAKQALQKIIAQFPDSSAAKLAKMRLKNIS